MTLTFIADPGTNYIGDINKLKELALTSMKAGATHFKPQIYQASEIYKQENNEYYELQQKCSLSFEQVEEIYNYCKEINIIPMFSCFSIKHLQWLEDIGCTNLKIAASMSGNNLFVAEASGYNFDIFVSFSKEYKHFSVWKYKDMFTNVQFMSCVSKYPANICDYNLKEVAVLQGISDHTTNICLSIAASALNCNVFERHVWFRYYNTPDISSSLHTEQFKNMVDVCNDVSAIR